MTRNRGTRQSYSFDYDDDDNGDDDDDADDDADDDDDDGQGDAPNDQEPGTQAIISFDDVIGRKQSIIYGWLDFLQS